MFSILFDDSIMLFVHIKSEVSDYEGHMALSDSYIAYFVTVK